MSNRYKEAIEELDRHFKAGGWSHDYDYVRAVIDNTLRPPPEMETVTVEHWAVIVDGAKCFHASRLEDCEAWAKNCYKAEGALWHIIPLTGTYRRPKPRPVEQSVVLLARVDEDGDIMLRCNGKYLHIPSDGPCPPADSECTVTVTWKEAPK